MSKEHSDHTILDQFDEFEVINSKFKVFGYGMAIHIVVLMLVIWALINFVMQFSWEETRLFWAGGMILSGSLVWDIHRSLWMVHIKNDAVVMEHAYMNRKKVLYFSEIKTYHHKKLKDLSEVFTIVDKNNTEHKIRSEFYTNYPDLKKTFVKRASFAESSSGESANAK